MTLTAASSTDEADSLICGSSTLSSTTGITHTGTESLKNPNGRLPLAIVNLGLIVSFVIIWIPALSQGALFSAHPIGVGIFIIMAVNGIIALQMADSNTRRVRTRWHSIIQLLSFVSLTIAVGAIYQNKENNSKPHYTTVHGRLGAFTYTTIIIVAGFGTALYFIPSLFGGALKARKTYYLHRLAGYFMLLMIITTASAALWSDWLVLNLHIA
ncbi:hypothetical protein HDU76_004619, partial [Blyttiomyces sp. JEL0837]